MFLVLHSQDGFSRLHYLTIYTSEIREKEKVYRMF